MAPTMPSGLWLVAPTNLNEKLVRSGTWWAAEGKGDGIVGKRETYRRRAVATGNSVTRAEMVQTCAVKSVPRAFGTEGGKKFGGARRRSGWQKSVCGQERAESIWNRGRQEVWRGSSQVRV